MKIIALDPGETTGWATHLPSWRLEAGKVVSVDCDEFHASHYHTGHIQPERTDHHLALEKFLVGQLCYDLTILLEAYEGHSEVVETTTAEYVGVVKYFVQRTSKTGYVRLLMRRPQNQAFWDQDKITKLGLWIPGQRHGMSALRHILHYQVFDLGREDILQRLK